MTKNKLFFIFAVLLLLAIAIPIGVNCLGGEALNVVDSISALIGAFCGVVTLLIAILLYNKYGVDKSITDENLKVVLAIVEELKKTTVFAVGDSPNGAYAAQLNFWMTDIAEFDRDVMRRYLDDTVYFRLSYAYAFTHLYELSRDPFVPKEISTAIKGIQLTTLPAVKAEEMPESYAVIFVSQGDSMKNEEVIGKFNGKEMTLRQYILRYQNVKESIKTWLVNHNVSPESLNF